MGISMYSLTDRYIYQLARKFLRNVSLLAFCRYYVKRCAHITNIDYMAY